MTTLMKLIKTGQDKASNFRCNAAYLVAFIFAVALSGCEQRRVDRRLDELCAQDGGMNIYEKVVLPSTEFNQYGTPVLFKGWKQSSGGFRFGVQHTMIKPDNPTLRKYIFEIVRESDGGVLGTYVVYIRVGGDIMPRLGPDSAKTCPSDGSEQLFLRSVFVQHR